MAKNPQMEKFMQDTVKLYDRTESEVTPAVRKMIDAAKKRLTTKKRVAEK